MDEIIISLDQSKVEILTYEVFDEVLENVAGGEKEKARNYTHAFCTGFVGCPG